MTTAGKIRLLMLLLSIILFFTAIIAKRSYTPANNLRQTAETLEHNLHQKEQFINTLLNNKNAFERLKGLPRDSMYALKLINDFTTEKSIWFITLADDRLSFWSGIKVIPDYPAAIDEGSSLLTEKNGKYEAIKKTVGNFSAIFFIPIKINYAFQNQYLQNTFAGDLVQDNNIEIAGGSDKNTYEIHSSIGHTSLFRVKLTQNDVNRTFLYYEIALWVLTLLCLCSLTNNICNYIAETGHIYLAILALLVFIIMVRFVNLEYGWPDLTYRLDIFSPVVFQSGPLYQSLGDFCMNILFICWFTTFIYSQRKKLLKKTPNLIPGYLILIGSVITLIVVSTGLLNLFSDLVINSKISFDVSNVLNLSPFSLLGVLMMCFSFLVFYLISEVLLGLSTKLPVPNKHKLYIFLAAIFLATFISTAQHGFTLFFILWAGLVLMRGYAYTYDDGKLDSISFTVIILGCAIISSLKLSNFEKIKEEKTRKAFVQKLEIPDDSIADRAFKIVERQILADSTIIQNFKDTLHNSNFIKTRLQKLYFSGYLSKYEFKVHEFDNLDQPISEDKNYSLSVFKDLVLYSSRPASTYFYRENESFGFLRYFAILPITNKKNSLGTIVIELKSKPLQSSASFPGLLTDGNVDLDEEFKGYSYAFYIDNNLLSQNGSFVYNLVNSDLNITKELKTYVFKTTNAPNTVWYSKFITYSHLIYKPSERNLIIVTREQNPLFFAVTSITFFFVVILVFGVLVVLLKWLWLRIKFLNVAGSSTPKWGFNMNWGRVLYKTRIQFSMVFAVVVTLVLVGFITFYSISAEYQSQQDKTIRDKITKIASAFEYQLYSRYLTNVDEGSQVAFNEFANTYLADLTLYDLEGNVLINTQPKIYEFGLQARRMNARAFITLSKLKKSEFINDETIGSLSYKAVYVPIRNSGYETIAFLQLPYFSNETDYRERIGSLLNIMINVYALVFLAIGLFAVIIARQITTPLNFIQQSLSKTIYGKKNEPIQWDRNDEIGALVKEYNKMISALEQSAQKLAQSERESAWREMAKQVAHEIKNPLTPLKLGLQLLDKSWKDKDPKFDQKFERFSKSFVEQIESLSSIASEFSAFARMPDTRIELLNLFEIVNQAVTIFKQMDNVKIVYNWPEAPFYIYADRDQILRCFNNLLKNAIEAAPPGRFGLIEINYAITAKHILLTIKDNGNGIAEGLREKIFEPNFTTKSSGTGLGLAFVKNSIENAGGKVWFETVLGAGTTFYLNIPAA